MTTTPAASRVSVIDRLGFPRGLGWGLLAVAIFMAGDAIEASWLSSFLSTSLDIPLAQAGMVITVYGALGSAAGFVAGVFADRYGPRTIMLCGVVAFFVFNLLFLGVAVPSGQYWLILLSYSLRGVAYPLFVYGMLAWVVMVAREDRQSSAVGWFWFAFGLGGNVLATYLASSLISLSGELATLWIGFAITIFGGLLGLFLTRSAPKPTLSDRSTNAFGSIWHGLSLMWRAPKVALGGLVKMLQVGAYAGLMVFYVVYVTEITGMDVARAVLIFTVYGLVSLVGNIVWGVLGDRIGWRTTSQWFGAFLSTLSIVYLWVAPNAFGANFGMLLLGGIALGVGMSAWVPVTPLTIAFAGGETGNAVAVTNLGTGIATFLGPAVVSAAIALGGYTSAFIVVLAFYAIAFVILAFLRLPGNAKTAHATSAEA